MTRRSVLALKRLRLELDQTLRGRPFFARAVTGQLTLAEYADLLAQLSALLAATGDEDLLSLARRDVPAARLPDACPAVLLFEHVAAREPGASPRGLARETCQAVLGTSWLRDAGDALVARRFGTRLVDRLAARAPRSLSRLEARLARRGDEDRALGLAELTRGAVLGIATYLDVRWPAPISIYGLGSFDPES